MRAPLFVAVTLALSLAVTAQDDIRVMSFNIRYGTANDGRNHWNNRHQLVAKTVGDFAPDVLGVQEALAFQVRYLEERLPHHERLGQGRNGGDRGEFSCLFVDTRRFDVLRSGDFWLSPTPDLVGSRGWDAALPRMCSWAVLRDSDSGAHVAVLNTHYDHRGQVAREQSSAVIVEQLREHSALPTIVMGDLNCGEDSTPLRALKDAGLRDAFRVLHPDAERAGTFNGFRGKDDGAKIDYLLVDDRLSVRAATIDKTRFDGDCYASDHFAVTATVTPKDNAPPKLKPVLAGEPWFIGMKPEAMDGLEREAMQVVDHAVFPSDDGRWHLWACVRGTKVGRVLYGWEGNALEQPFWRSRGVVMRSLRSAGESIDDWDGQEWIQAPFVLRHDDTHYMFYGGHRSENGSCQICLATSQDGRTFARYADARGFSRVFVGPGEARDPMVLAVDGTWHCYYTGHDEGARAPCKIYCRTSTDLVTFSDPVAVNWGGRAGDGKWSAECPFVVHRDGYFYLFRTTSYRTPLTHVYRSTDPLDFGRGDDAKYVGTIAVAAPELVESGGRTYVSTVHALDRGVQLQRLLWVKAD